MNQQFNSTAIGEFHMHGLLKARQKLAVGNDMSVRIAAKVLIVLYS